ncbi:hypothetical protein [Pediococcus acidilactici]|uniref:hypothetical protein n=1 Tax=Pediococcus acidilactici TaxID=1254 RepID=UPI003F20D7F6
MAESNATQVILTDDGLKIIKAQNTANVAAGNINDINSDNKLTPSEKLKLKQEYDKDVELYNIDIEQLKSVNLPTAELETAMSNLTNLVTPLFKEMNITSTVDRNALNSVFTAFAAADKNASQAFVNMVQQVADDAKKAGDDAKETGEKAQEAGEEAKASANQAQVDAAQAKTEAATAQQKAQDSIDQLNAHLPDIDEALSTANLVKQNVTKLSDTTEQYHNEYTTGIQNVIKTIGDARTEIDQISDEIKLKANSSDVTSQIAVAINGIQNTVNNKADKSQVSQLADQITSVVSDVSDGKINLIVNGGFEHGTDNWIFEDVSNWSINKNNGYQPFTEDYIRITPDGKGYITQELVRFNGLSVSDWNFNFYYNIQNNVSGYVKAYLKINYEDGTFKYINDTKLTANNNAWQRMSVKINKADLYAVAGIYLRLQFTGASGGGNVYYSQFQISRGADDKPYTKSDLDNATQSQITQLKNDINLRVSKNDVVNQINISNEGILIDGKKVHITGNTSIDNAVIKNTMIADAAINTAQIADGAINNAKIANAAIDDAKISNLNGNKIIAGSITANKINVDDLIANGINTKTLTSVNLNTSTLTTPQLDLGLNGTFTEDFDYTQDTSIFLPKKNKGTLTFNHGVLQSRGNMQTYVGGQWGGMNDNYTFQAGIDNSQWTEVAPGYIKLDLFKQNDTDVAERAYVDPTGFYYTTNSNQAYTSYVGNIVSTPQVQTSSVLTKYIGPSAGQNLLQIDNNGSDYGLQVGSYAGKEAVLSDYIYDFTVSTASNVYITSNGHLGRSTSASKYKYNISNPEYEDVLGDRLLNVHLASWNDKNAIDSYAHTLNTGEDTEKISIDKYHGLIAEQLRNAGLEMFVEYNEDGEIEGIQYDRAWIPLLAVVRRLNNRINEYEMRISKLEGKK